MDTIKVIDKENGGHGSTINVGIKYANGKYFRAIDGDDWVNTNDLKKLIKSLEIIEVDMVLTNFLKCYEDGKIEKEEFENIIPEKIYSFEEIVKQVKWMCYHSVIYRTKLLKEYDIRLDETGARVLRNVFKICKKYLTHIQNSTFEGELTPSSLKKLQYEKFI